MYKSSGESNSANSMCQAAINDMLAESTCLLQNLNLSNSSQSSKKTRKRKTNKRQTHSTEAQEVTQYRTQSMNGTCVPMNKSTTNPFLRALQMPMNPRFIPTPKQIFVNTSILGLEADSNMSTIHNVVEYKDLEIHSPRFKTIKAMFPPDLLVLKIVQVFNPFLRLSFQLKQHFKYSDVSPLKLFHGTKRKYVHSICTNNFDWRFYGAERGHRYGKGVNFTPQPKFSMHFCDKDVNEKVVILSDVLVIHKSAGSENTHLPPPGCDTTIRENNKTFVKFCDAEFYPCYVIFFCKV